MFEVKLDILTFNVTVPPEEGIGNCDANEREGKKQDTR